MNDEVNGFGENMTDWEKRKITNKHERQKKNGQSNWQKHRKGKEKKTRRQIDITIELWESLEDD